MKKKLLISVVSLVSMFGMTACGGETSSITSANNESSVQISDSSTQTSESSATTYTGIAITNKEELTAEWHVGEAQRKVNINLTPAGNVNTLIQQGLVSVTSDHTDVVQVIGTMLSPVGVGEANITVKVGAITDTVKITVAETLSEPEYVTGKTFAEITADGLASDVAYVAKFKVSKLGQKEADTTAGDYGNFFVTAEDGTGTPILVYGASTKASALNYDLTKKAYKFTNPKDFSINADTKDIAVGTVLTGVVIRADYQSTKELSMVITAVDNKPVANGVLDTDAVQEVKNSKIYSYQVAGKITKWTKGEDGSKYGNFYIKSEGAKGEELQVYGATATASALTNDGTSNAFTNPQDFLTNEATKDLKVGDDVTMLAIRCDYQGTIEITGLIIANVEPVKVIDATVDEALTACNALADNGRTTDMYAVTGYITAVTTAYSTQYKNISLTIADSLTETDATKMLTIYRGELADGVEADKLVAGAQIKVTGYLKKYVKDGAASLQIDAGGEIALLKENEVVAPTAIALPETASVNMGDTLTLTLTLTPVNATLTGDVAWTSSQEGVATVDKGVVTPVSAGTTVITATYGDLTATCTVTVAAALNYGTEAAPLSVTELNTLGATIVPSNNNWSSKVVYVSAKISSVPTYNSSYKSYTFDFVDPTDSTKKGAFYSGDFDTDVTKIAQNDTVVLAGYLKNQNGTFQISFNSKATDDFKTPKVLSRTAGTSAITVDATSSANVTVSEVAATAANDTTVSFTAVAKEGYTLNKVLVNNKEITAAEGTYSFVVEGDTTISFDVKSSSGPVSGAEETVTLSYSGSTTNMDGTNQAALLGLDNTVFTAVGSKINNGSNNVGLNKDGTIRFYVTNSKPTCKLDLSVASGYAIVSVSPEVTSGTLDVVVNDEKVTGEDGLYSINAESVTFSTSGTAQAKVKSISITYKVL